MQKPQAHWLPDGKRLHLNHGPIDLIIEAFGKRHEVEAAYAQAVARFQTILSELVAELPVLRRAVEPVRVSVATPSELYNLNAQSFRLTGPTAGRMYSAVLPYAETFVTPMAAVAGSVADEIMAALLAGRAIDKAYVNNGGDIALHLEAGQELNIAVVGTGHGFSDRVVVRADDPVRGVATSGWRGRSFSLGIADAVTVLARTGAEADAAATMIANAVDLPGHPAVRRLPANELAPDSDLGARMVTVGVGALSPADISEALASGLAVAEELRRRGLIEATAMFLDCTTVTCGTMRSSAEFSTENLRPFAPSSVLPDISSAGGSRPLRFRQPTTLQKRAPCC